MTATPSAGAIAGTADVGAPALAVLLFSGAADGLSDPEANSATETFQVVVTGTSPMTNFPVQNNKVGNLPLQALNTGTGVVGPWPTGVAASAVSSAPNSLGVSIGPPANLILTPKVMQSQGITVTVSGVGMTAAAPFLVDIVPDPNAPLQVVIDTTHYTTTAQNVPTAPGP